MVWKPILEQKEDIMFVIDILHKIAANLLPEKDGVENNSLMYGDLGKIIFLANYLNIAESDEIDEKVTTMFDDVYQSVGQRIYDSITQVAISNDLDFSFEKGLSGIGWGMNYLIKSRFIEGEISDIMGLVDANIYRQMIEKLHDLTLNSFNISISNGKYAICRDGRLSKEYLYRFISEFYDLKDVYFEKYAFEKDSANDIARLISLLQKIDVKYNFKKNSELLNLFYSLLYSKTMEMPKVDLRYLHAWFILCCSDKYNNHVMRLFKDNYKFILTQADQLQMDSGLQSGVVFTGYIANKLYQMFNFKECKDISLRCFDILLKKRKPNDLQDKFEEWSTASQMLWGVHQNLYNGLSGIGLALMAIISDNVPDWDECIV